MKDDTEVLPRTPTEIEHDDLNSAIAQAAPRRWWNTTTLVLMGVVLLVAGVLGGAQMQKHWGSSPAADSPAGPANPGFPGQNRSGTPQNTEGTITRVDGTTIYLQTSTNETITVRASDATTVSKATTATLTDLTAGLKITVQGLPDSSGVVAATAITAAG